VPAAGPSVYAAGQNVRFAFEIASGGPQPEADRLTMRTRLFRDGAQVWESAAMNVETDAKKAASFFASGSLQVPKGLDPGKYMLRLDISEKERPDIVSAWQWAKLTVQ
jgi:hypothetical protein